MIYNCGMAGCQRVDRRMLDALSAAGMAVRINEWCGWWFPLVNLRSRARHAAAAEEAVRMVEQARAEGEGSIVLLGHSTGCLVTLDALERLVAEGAEPVDAAVLLAAAVDPDYDLTPALPGARRLISLRSPLDGWFLGLGTAVFGTADGRHRPAAGMVGFRGPGADDPRFEQHRFQRRWLRCGHYGGHLGCLSPRFGRAVLHPLLEGIAPEAEEADSLPADSTPDGCESTG